ncbi:MAG: DUF350 domain-containing protein [Lachnospiraceae bacterium]|nr:DUF350 domain-containing protein [Lachnospiraceae bacterium]
MTELISIAVYCVLGIVLMLLGTYVVDLVIPCHFPTEIKKKNVAVGCVMAGISIGIGIVIKSAIMTISIDAVEETLLSGVVSTVGYYLVGLVFCIIGYLLLNLINKKYNLNQEIGEGNAAAGIMVAGMFIGLCTIISGVIM